MADEPLFPSANVIDFQRLAVGAEGRPLLRKTVETGGGGGNSGGMDGTLPARVAVLEQISKDTSANLAEIKAELRGLRGEMGGVATRLANVEGRLDALSKVTDKIPSGWTIFSMIIGTLVAVPSILGGFMIAARHFGLFPLGQ